MGLATQENQYLSGRAVLNCGEETASEIDQEVMKILKESYEEAKRLLSENREIMDKIAEFLIEKETITGKEFMKIFRECKGIKEDDSENQTPAEKLEAEVTAEEAERKAEEQVSESAEPVAEPETVAESEKEQDNTL